MLTGLVTTVARPVASRVVTAAVARTVRPPANRLRAALAILTRTRLVLPAATSKRPSPITRQPRAQRAARARARLGFPRGALPASLRTTVPRQPPATAAGQASGTGRASAPAPSTSGALT